MRVSRKNSLQYPIGTLMVYGPDNTRATKLVAAVFSRPGKEEPDALHRWFVDTGDIRNDADHRRRSRRIFQTVRREGNSSLRSHHGLSARGGGGLSDGPDMSAMSVLGEPSTVSLTSRSFLQRPHGRRKKSWRNCPRRARNSLWQLLRSPTLIAKRWSSPYSMQSSAAWQIRPDCRKARPYFSAMLPICSRNGVKRVPIRSSFAGFRFQERTPSRSAATRSRRMEPESSHRLLMATSNPSNRSS